jgi:hypothetical protein
VNASACRIGRCRQRRTLARLLVHPPQRLVIGDSEQEEDIGRAWLVIKGGIALLIGYAQMSSLRDIRFPMGPAGSFHLGIDEAPGQSLRGNTQGPKNRPQRVGQRFWLWYQSSSVCAV